MPQGNAPGLEFSGDAKWVSHRVEALVLESTGGGCACTISVLGGNRLAQTPRHRTIREVAVAGGATELKLVDLIWPESWPTTG